MAALPRPVAFTKQSASGPVAVTGECLNVRQLLASCSEAANDSYVGDLPHTQQIFLAALRRVDLPLTLRVLRII